MPRKTKETKPPKTTKRRKRAKYLESFYSELPYNAPKDLLLIYDIPETQKIKRDWFRRQLQTLRFKMIKRTVWVGPYPLPKKFMKYVESIGLKNRFQTFKLDKGYKKRR